MFATLLIDWKVEEVKDLLCRCLFLLFLTLLFSSLYLIFLRDTYLAVRCPECL